MKKKKFKAEVLSGHKDDAVEVPFDPTEIWGIEAKSLWRGRKGHAVKGKLNGQHFESFIVPRQKRFFILIDKEIERATGVSQGDVIEVSVEPSRDEIVSS